MSLIDKGTEVMGEARMPLGVLVDRICQDLYMVFVGNGYKQIGFTLIAHSIDDGESCASGNLKPDGIKALLEQCLEEMNRVKELPN
jgi:hypothetical protein